VTFPELGVKATTETILLLGIGVYMMTRILAQVIEELYVLKHDAISMCKCQEFIQLPIQESLGNVMCPKGCPEFFPIDDIIGR